MTESTTYNHSTVALGVGVGVTAVWLNLIVCI